MNAEFWKKQQPPTHRDFEIYRYVKITDHSTREAADAWGLSQTRIMQIVQCVHDFLRLTAPIPKAAKQEDMLRYVWVAENISAERLQQVTGAMMRLWERSLGVRFLNPKGGTKSNSIDECRYALTIGKLSLMQAKLPASQLWSTEPTVPGTDRAAIETVVADEAVEAEQAEEVLEDETDVVDEEAEELIDTDLELDEPEHAPEPSPPLVGCSTSAVNSAKPAHQAAATLAASDCQAEGYCEVDLRPILIDNPDLDAFRTLFNDEEWDGMLDSDEDERGAS